MWEGKTSKLPVPPGEKIKPNNSSLLGTILELHPNLTHKVYSAVRSRLKEEGKDKSIGVEDIVQKAFLNFIESNNPPAKDWSEDRIFAWMYGVIKNIITTLYHTDGDLHRRRQKTMTIQFASSGVDLKERRGIPTEGEISDKKYQSPLDKLIEKERVAVHQPFGDITLDRIRDKNPKFQAALDLVSKGKITARSINKEHVQEARILVLLLKNPGLSEKEFSELVVKSLGDRYIDPVLIKKHYYGEENFMRAIDELKDWRSNRIAQWYYLDYFGYGKIAKLLGISEKSARTAIEKTSEELSRILSSNTY